MEHMLDKNTLDKDRKFVVSTGKKGYIDYLIALDKAMYGYIDKPYPAELEEKNRLELENDLVDGLYTID